MARKEEVRRNIKLRQQKIYNNSNSHTLIAGGRKGRVRERRLMKGFQIGLVEDLISSVIAGSEKGPIDVFGKLAKVIAKRSSSKALKRSDWNALAASKASLKRTPIGCKEASTRRWSQQSLRRSVVESERAALLSMDPNQLVEYNPRLKEYTPATRVAYAKFKSRTLGPIKEKKEEREGKDNTRRTTVKKSNVSLKNLVPTGSDSELRKKAPAVPTVSALVENNTAATPASSSGPSTVTTSAQVIQEGKPAKTTTTHVTGTIPTAAQAPALAKAPSPIPQKSPSPIPSTSAPVPVTTAAEAVKPSPSPVAQATTTAATPVTTSMTVKAPTPVPPTTSASLTATSGPAASRAPSPAPSTGTRPPPARTPSPRPPPNRPLKDGWF